VVSAAASSNDMERRQIAMASAETCSDGMLPSARPAHEERDLLG
jgi:hypothetical protein